MLINNYKVPPVTVSTSEGEPTSSRKKTFQAFSFLGTNNHKFPIEPSHPRASVTKSRLIVLVRAFEHLLGDIEW